MTADYWVEFAPGIIMFGIGWGMTTPLLNSLALEWIEDQYFGEANGLFNTGRYTGAAVGTGAVFALLANDTGPESLPSYDDTLLFFMISTALACVLIWLPLGEKQLDQ